MPNPFSVFGVFSGQLYQSIYGEKGLFFLWVLINAKLARLSLVEGLN